MARARRLEARGDPPIAISGCSNFAARLAGVKLRAQLPSRRVAAHNLPRHWLALSGQEVGCTQSGRALGLLDLCNRAVEVRHRRIHSLPPRPSGLPTHSQLGVRPRPLPLGQQVTQWLHRERAWTRRHFHDGERAGVQEHTALISTAVSVAPACVPAGSGEMCVARRVQGVRDGTAPARISGVEPAATAPGI